MQAQDLKDARILLGLSQKELALELDWSIRQITNLENGARPIQKQTALAIECLLRRAKLWNQSTQISFSLS